MKFGEGCKYVEAGGSPPARGAWIEMVFDAITKDKPTLSPPARGAWIEICRDSFLKSKGYCRPPHGGRGLKSIL